MLLVLTGRGASIHANPGNQKFRALCFARKAYFDAGNHAAKRRVGNEIVTICMEQYGSRFLRREILAKASSILSSRESSADPQRFGWVTMTKEEAILKASQVMRDHKRPDRRAQRELMVAQGRRRKRLSTHMDDSHMVLPPEAPCVENPLGVNSNDVICGRGAFASDHSGNKRLRELAIERKARFDAGNSNEKKMLAVGIVQQIGKLNPPGLFLKRILPNQRVDPADTFVAVPPTEDDCGWFQLEDDVAVQKACQAMRDISRPDRQERDEMRRLRRLTKGDSIADSAKVATTATMASVDDSSADIDIDLDHAYNTAAKGG